MTNSDVVDREPLKAKAQHVLALPTEMGTQSQPTAPRAVLVAGFAALTIAGLGTIAPVVDQTENIRYASSWTNDGSVVQQRVASSRLPTLEESSVDESYRYDTTAEGVYHLHVTSGLTWEQLARLFSVSRRAVHLWASGKAMNARHTELLAQIVDTVERLPGDSPSAKRQAILTPRSSGPSIYDELRMERADAQVISESSFHHVSEEVRRS